VPASHTPRNCCEACRRHLQKPSWEISRMKLGLYSCGSAGTCIMGIISHYVLPTLQLVAVLLSITLSVLGLKAWFQSRKTK
jgi:hypothetical protein